LRGLHERLDAAVAEAYGWPPSAASDPEEQERLLLARNLELARGTGEGYFAQ
jgi:hypothetical protein